MHYNKGINNKTLKMNTGDVLKTYDKNGNGLDKKELKDLIKNSITIFAKPFVKDKHINNVYDNFDTNKDGVISEKEMDSYLKQNYGIDLETAKGMKVKDLSDAIYKADQAKKKK